jgi:TolB-like protein
MQLAMTDLTRWCVLAALTAFAFNVELYSAAAQAPSAARPTVAVLPFLKTSGDSTPDFFIEGMTDEIASALTSVRGIDVVGRSSVFQHKPSTGDVRAIGRSLNANHLLQGVARMTADRMHARIV